MCNEQFLCVAVKATLRILIKIEKYKTNTTVNFRICKGFCLWIRKGAREAAAFSSTNFIYVMF